VLFPFWPKRGNVSNWQQKSFLGSVQSGFDEDARLLCYYPFRLGGGWPGTYAIVRISFKANGTT
jgi:hypothetical protein